MKTVSLLLHWYYFSSVTRHQEWTPEYLKTFVGSQKILDVPLSSFDAFYRGGEEGIQNPWRKACPQAPFDQAFRLQFNLAVGGTNGYFTDGKDEKPWDNRSPTAAKEFWDSRDQWMPSWDLFGENSSLAVDSVKVYKVC